MSDFRFSVGQPVRMADADPKPDVVVGEIIEGMGNTASGQHLYLVQWPDGTSGWLSDETLAPHYDMDPIQTSHLQRQIETALSRPWTGQDTDFLRAIYRSGLVVTSREKSRPRSF